MSVSITPEQYALAVRRAVDELSPVGRMSYDVVREIVGWSTEDCWGVGEFTIGGTPYVYRQFQPYAESPDRAIEVLGYLRSSHDAKYVLTALTFSKNAAQRFSCTIQIRVPGGVTRAYSATSASIAEAICTAALAAVRAETGPPGVASGVTPHLHSPIARAVAESGRAFHVAALVETEIAMRDAEIERLHAQLEQLRAKPCIGSEN